MMLAFMSVGATSAPSDGDVRAGLVACWEFDEGTGLISKDHGPHKLDARIAGAEWAKGDEKWGLDFFPGVSYAEAPNALPLQISGPVTVTTWIKSLGTKRVQYVVSKWAWNIYVDNDRVPHFEVRHAKAGRWLAVRSEKRVEWNRWYCISGVHDPAAGKLRVHVNGARTGERPYGVGRLGTPDKYSIKFGRFVRGTSQGFSGFIGETRVYDRALTDDEIRRIYVATKHGMDGSLRTTSPQRLVLTPRQYYLSSQRTGVSMRILLRGDPPPRPYPVVAELFCDASREAVARAELADVKSEDVEVVFDGPEPKPGDYTIRGVARDGNGKVIARSSAGTKRLPPMPKPEWLGTKAGITDKVLPPFTPMQTHRTEAGIDVRVWGRRYRFGTGLFPEQIETRGRQILAGPMQVKATVDGEPVRWQAQPLKLACAKPHVVEFSRSWHADGVSLTGKVLGEYDGFLRIDWELTAQRPVNLSELTFEIPLKREHARYMFCHRFSGEAWRNVIGRVPDHGLRSPFRPVIWLGDEDRGLEWLAETDEQWHNTDPNNAIQIARDGGTTVLRLVLVDKAVSLGTPEPGPLRYAFGLQATPMRPMARTVWDYRISNVGQWAYYGFEKDAKQLDPMKQFGIRTFNFFEHWTDWESYPTVQPRHREALKSFVDGLHRQGFHVLLYFGFLMSSLAPEYPYLAEECINRPRSGWDEYNYPPQPMQACYRVCYNSAWKDFCLHHLDKLVEEYGTDGFYLDGTAQIAPGCKNTSHGCGYRRADGTIAPTYAVFATRDIMKRIYGIVISRNPNGQINLHQSGEMVAPSMAWCTSYWDGEQFVPREKEFVLSALPLDMFRTELTGRQWGCAAELLTYRLPCTYEQAAGLAFLHDVPVRPGGGASEHARFMSKVWSIRDAFDCGKAEWLPYWSNAQYVTVERKDVYASLYVHPKNGVLAFIYNLTRKEATAEVELDLARLQLGAHPSARDAWSDKPVGLRDGSFELTLPSMGWTFVWVRPAGAPEK